MNKLDFAAINHALNPEAVVPQWLPDGHRRGKEWVCTNPTRNDRNPGSFTVNLIEGNWKDFATGDGGADLVSLYAYVFCGGDQGAAARDLSRNHGVRLGDPEVRQQAAEAAKVRNIEEAKPVPVLPIPASATVPTFRHHELGEPSQRWEYRDREGRILMYVCRFDPPGMRKQVLPYSWCKHPNGTERWTWRGITKPRKVPLYGLDRLAADPEADALVVEGEKTADAAVALMDGTGMVPCSWLGGVDNADRVNLAALAGRRVVLWPDFDSQKDKDGNLLPLHEQPGVRAMMAIAQALKGTAREIVLIGYQVGTQFASGWDLADAQAQGWSQQQVMEYMRANAGDPWHVASAQPVQAAAPVPANDNTEHLPLDASVNPFGWPHMSDKGQPLNTVENLAYMLDQYGITCRYNEVRKTTEVILPGRSYTADNRANCTLAEITSIAARNRMPQSMLADYIKLLADRSAYNPVKDWIQSKPWDGTKRVQQLCETVHVAGDRTLTDKLIYRWLVSAVAALFMPVGFESHGVLVFTGKQGQGKTKWIKRLVPQEMLDVVLVGAVLDPNNKDTVTNAISHWLVELGELDATFRKADIARLKSFVTNATDKVRRPYDRIESEYQRRTVFFASVNEEKYLVDDTGNRRWWTVPTVSVDHAHTIDMQQVWAELLVAWRAGEQHWLTQDEFDALNQLNAEHENVDPVEEIILGAFEWGGFDVMHAKEMTASEVLMHIGFDKPTKAQATHASKVLKKLTGRDPVKRKNGRFFQLPPAVKKTGAFAHNDETRPF